MNDSLEPTIKLETRPEVAAFVAKVRDRLGDLSDEEREELTGGLEADLAELVAERGSDVSTVDLLGDPKEYADELRAAAGLELSRKKGKIRRPRRPDREVLTEWLDGARDRWEHLVEHPRLAPVWEALVLLRPGWWVLRAWLAVQVLDIVTGPWEAATLVPTLYGPFLGGLLLLVAIVASVQIGRAQLWPGTAFTSSVLARVLVLGINAAAIVSLPSVFGEFPTRGGPDIYNVQGGVQHKPAPGLMIDGHYVRNVFAYDTQGKPIAGVQLFDQRGRPLAIGEDFQVSFRGPGNVVAYPWLNGNQGLFNVFPLPTRQQRGDGQVENAWTSATPPALPTPPLAVVPPVALPVSTGSTTGEKGSTTGEQGDTEGGKVTGRQ